MAAPIIFKGTKAQLLNSADLSFKDGTTIVPYAGNPNGAVTRTKGSIICDKTNGKLYINTDGATAWAELTQDTSSSTLEFTGFTNNQSIDVSYDSGTKKITLTGTFVAYWRGQPVTALTSGWVSDAHSSTLDTTYYLYYNGSSFIWDTNPWTFDMLQIAVVWYGTAHKFAIRECHGFMDWQTHRNLHESKGTYCSTLGTVFGLIYDSTVAANRRPLIASTTVMDEDLPTSVPENMTQANFAQFYISGAFSHNIVTGAAEIIPLSGSNPYYNKYSTGVFTQELLLDGECTSVWVFALPVTSDAASQAYRYLMVQGQSVGSYESQFVLDANTVYLGDFTNAAAEYVAIAKIIIQYTSGDWIVKNTIILQEGTRAKIAGLPTNYYATTENVELTKGTKSATSINTLQDVISNEWTSGRVSTAPTITDNGDNTVDVSSCEIMLRNANSPTADLRLWKVAALNDVSVPLETTRYLVADYNAGSPIMAIRAPGATNVNNNSIIALAILVNAGGTIQTMDFGDVGANLGQRVYNYLGTRYGQLSRLSGAVPSSPAGRYLQTTAGAYAIGARAFVVGAFDSAGADRIKTIYGDAATGWTRTTGVQQLGNTHYWNPTTHTLTALSATSGGFYTCWWIFQLVDTPNVMIAFLHTAESSAIATIRAATITTDVPVELTNRTSPSTLIAKLIVRQGQTDVQEVINITSPDSQQTPTSDHNSLGGLQGGTSGQYYHLTATEYTTATATNSMFTTNVGIGVTGVGIATQLHVASTSTSSPRGIMSGQHNNGTDGARFHLRKSRGTVGTPTVITSGDNLGRLVGSGYDGSNYLEMCSIDFVSSGTIASTRIPTDIAFSTATDATPSVLTERMRITNLGNVGIGTADVRYGNTSTNVRWLTIAGAGTEDTSSCGYLSLLNNRPTETVGDIAGQLDFNHYYNGVTPSYTTRIVSKVHAVLSGSGGTNGFGGDLIFYTKPDNSTTITERMRITNTGNVAIGINTPTSLGTNIKTLDIRGTNSTSGYGSGIILGKSDTVTGGIYSVNTDFFLYANSQAINFSVDYGSTKHATIDTTGRLKTNYGVAYARRTATATGSITNVDHFVDASHASTAIELTLAAVSTFLDGQEIVVTRTNDATVRVTANSGEYINGSAFVDLPNKYSSMSIHCDGTGWTIH